MYPFAGADTGGTQGYFDGILQNHGHSDGPAAPLQHQNHQRHHRQADEPQGQQVDGHHGGHIAAGAKHADEGSEDIGADRNGKKARDGQRRGDAGGFARQIEQGEDIRLEQDGNQQQRHCGDAAANGGGEAQQRVAQCLHLAAAFALADGLADENGGGAAQGVAHHLQQAVHVAHDGMGGQQLHRAGRMAQDDGDEGGAGAPGGLVEHHGSGIAQEAAQHIRAGTAEGRRFKGQALAAQGADEADDHLHHTGDEGGEGRAGHTQSGEAALAEDEQPVQRHVQRAGGAEYLHAEGGVLHAAAGADIRGGDHVEQVGEANDPQIGRADEAQPVIVAEQIHDGHREDCQNQRDEQGYRGAQHTGHAQTAVDAAGVLAAPVLAGQDAQAVLGAEDEAVEDEGGDVGCCDGGHLQIAQLADHEGIRQTQGKGDDVLEDHGQGQQPQPFVKAGLLPA